jgi:hypothetical protein
VAVGNETINSKSVTPERFFILVIVHLLIAHSLAVRLLLVRLLGQK